MSRDTLTDDFLRSVARRYSPGTLKAYIWGLQTWEKFLGDRLHDPESWRAKDVERWQEDLWDRGLGARSRQLAASALRACLKWAARHERLPRLELYLAVDGVRAQRLLPRPLSPRDLNRILVHFSSYRPDAPLTWWRDRALFLYLLSTSARVSEALQLTVADFRDGVIVRQKGGSEKALFATDSALEAVLMYIARRKDNHPALWCTHGGGLEIHRLSPDAVREIWIRLARKVGVAPFNTHRIRHTSATELEDAKVSPDVIAAHLGHHDLSSLAGYAEIRIGRRQEAVDALERRIREAMKPRRQPGIVAIKAGRRRTNMA